MVRDMKEVSVPWKREQLLKLFNSYDKDGDGRLSKDELKAAFRHLGSRWSSYRAGKALRKNDHNRDGFITQDELIDLVDYALERGYKVG